MHLRQLLHPRRHTLMAVAPTHLGQAQAVGLDQADPGLFDLVDELPHARVTSRGLKVNFNNGLGCSFQAHTHRVKAEQDFG